MGFNASTKHATAPAPTVVEVSEGGFQETCIIMQHVVASGTDGGTLAQAVWQTRPLNVLVRDDTGQVSLVANQFTLPAGTYAIRARLPGYGVDNHTGRLWNVTDSAITLHGVMAFCGGIDNEAHADSWVLGAFSIASPKTFEIQNFAGRAQAGNGLGISSGLGTVSIFTTAELIKSA